MGTVPPRRSVGNCVGQTEWELDSLVQTEKASLSPQWVGKVFIALGNHRLSEVKKFKSYFSDTKIKTKRR
jgi:hypothetical protein